MKINCKRSNLHLLHVLSPSLLFICLLVLVLSGAANAADHGDKKGGGKSQGHVRFVIGPIVTTPDPPGKSPGGNGNNSGNSSNGNNSNGGNGTHHP